MKVLLGLIVAICVISVFAGFHFSWQDPKPHPEERSEGIERPIVHWGQQCNENEPRQNNAACSERNDKVHPRRDLRYMKEIAQAVGMDVGEEVTEAELAAEIRLHIQEAEDRTPRIKPLSEDVVSALKDVLGASDYEAVKMLNNAVKQMEGLRLLALPLKVRNKVK